MCPLTLLKQLRIDKGLSRKQLAKKSRVKYYTIQAYEQTNRYCYPKPKTLDKLLKVYDMTISDFVKLLEQDLPEDRNKY